MPLHSYSKLNTIVIVFAVKKLYHFWYLSIEWTCSLENYAIHWEMLIASSRNSDEKSHMSWRISTALQNEVFVVLIQNHKGIGGGGDDSSIFSRHFLPDFNNPAVPCYGLFLAEFVVY